MEGFKIRLLLTVCIFLSIVNANRTVFINPNNPWQVFEGWGTSLCWWANMFGGFPDVRDKALDLVFDLNKGLGLNVIRYNIGGGDDPSHHHMRIGGNVPGFLPCKTCSYNWTSDANQRWVLFAAKERGADIFEAFSNSPPYWMTNSGCSSGGHLFSNNLNSNYYDAYADYLTEVVKWYKEQGLTFRTLEPFNEPTERYWKYFGYQEGCSYICSVMNIITKKVGEYLNKKGLSNETSISAFDEHIIDEEIYTESCIDNDAKSYIGQYNTHAYGGTQRMQLFNISKQDNKRLWMSELGLYSSKNMSTSINLSEAILNDMRNLKPVAWIYWQVIEHAPNGNDGNDWGLIGADFSNSTTSLDKRLSFYGFAQYTKFIRPGYQIISSNDNDTLAAFDANSKTLVLVCTNKKHISDVWKINVSMFNISSFTAFRTSNNNETLNLLPNIWNITGGILTYLSPANSITTWNFSLAIANFTQ
ncbi:O-Glycosyl hydrolase family 30 [Gigaspora margarita]|uniref:O-Glycosyl hydrolase family 30 n=1 Tax=Gigaspora margarita TaxID=4874 RepID=A0A8H3XAE7_GIGMA|nr:O-Glycosyl hydrolase family 30 [Gigaspora margarita]